MSAPCYEKYLTNGPFKEIHKPLGFSHFQFKIRLIRLGLSFQKTKIPVFELKTYWFTARSHNH